MNRLSSNNLPEEASLSYDKTKVTAGIVILGWVISTAPTKPFTATSYCPKAKLNGVLQVYYAISRYSECPGAPGLSLYPDNAWYRYNLPLVGAIQEILVAPENPAAILMPLPITKPS